MYPFRLGTRKIHSLLGLAVTNLQRGVVVDERSFQIVHSHSVDSTLFAVQLDAVQVDHCGEDGEFHETLKHTEQSHIRPRHVNQTNRTNTPDTN